jgi:hypothetical protein
MIKKNEKYRDFILKKKIQKQGDSNEVKRSFFQNFCGR